MYNYGLDHKELGEQFLVLTTRVSTSTPRQQEFEGKGVALENKGSFEDPLKELTI